jgi:hypothetical protein
MEQTSLPSKAQFVFTWGLLWGSCTALLTALWDWHSGRSVGPPYMILGRFAIFIGVGSLYGLFRWQQSRKGLGPKKLPRTKSVARTVLFFGLMLGLVYALWILK